jgi:hypothetical protein
MVSFTFLEYGSQCVPKFKWHCDALYFPLHITLNVLDHTKLIEIKGLEKCCIANKDATHPLQMHP